jgi:CDP-diacylglycerol--serine O-phosphatidyltransferase
MFNLPNLFTAGNLICGVLAILLTLAGRIDLAPFAIFAGAFLDFFDGFLARKLKVEGELGKQLDSLADVVTFGVAPGLLMMVVIVVSIYPEDRIAGEFASNVHFQLQNWMNAIFYGVPNNMSASIAFLPFWALLIPFFSMFRLAKFNIDTRQTTSFIGVPTPLNALFFTFFPLCLWINFPDWTLSNPWYMVLFNPFVLVAFVIGMSLMLIAPLPLFALKFKSFGWKGNEVRYTFLLLSIGLIPFLQVWAIPLIVFLYLILSASEALFKKQHHEIQS